jgi:Protein of unknown function (DUF4236)
MTAHLRVWRRLRLLPGITANISKRGLTSFSFGRRGAHLTLGRKGRRITVGVPGSTSLMSSLSAARGAPASGCGLRSPPLSALAR